MNTSIVKFIIFVLLSTQVSSSTDILRVFREQEILIETKSYKGWIRVLNNDKKLKLYGLDNYSKQEIEEMKLQLRQIMKNELGGNL